LKRIWGRLLETLRRDFVAGLLVIVPVGFTILGVLWGVEQLDKLVLPRVFSFLGFEARQPPLAGVIVTMGMILVAGALTRSFLGRWFIRNWESTIDRIPVARSLYAVLKQFMEAIFGSSRDGFRRVVLVEYPRTGVWCYAFTTGLVDQQIPGLPESLIKIFIPSTPNPTTGYFLLLAASEVVDTGLSVEEAFKLIISAGIAGEGEVRLSEAGPVPAAPGTQSESPR
jgi:uncharacterized membrane protein